MWQIDVLVEGVRWTTLSCLAIMIMCTAAWRSRHGVQRILDWLQCDRSAQEALIVKTTHGAIVLGLR